MHQDNVLAAFKTFAQYGNFIRDVIRSKLRNQDEADDVFQDFFLSLVSNPVPMGVKNIKSYLYRAITNDIVDAVRRTEAYKSHLRTYNKDFNYSVNNAHPESALMEKEEIDRMFELMERHLKEGERTAIKLRYMEQCSFNEVAEDMGVKPRSASRYVCVGLGKIRQLLKAKGGDGNDSS